MSGYTMTMPELYYALPAAVTKNNFTTISVISAQASTSVPRCMIPANYFTLIGKSARFVAYGTVANTTAATIVYTLGLDTTAGTLGTTLGATAAITPTSSTTCPFVLWGDITCQAVGNAGTTLQANFEVDVQAAASGTVSTARQTVMITTTATGVNNEVAQYFEIFGTWSAASASNTTTLQQFKVYLENLV